MRILVDWRAASEAGWSPDAEAALTVERQSVAWALDRLLTPMRLTCRIVDEKTLQVTSPQREADRVELEFYPVADLVSEQHDGGRLIELVQTRLGQSAFGSSRGGGVLRFDADSQCLLAAMPQPGQIALADLLDQRRANKQRVGPESQ
jgi:hypothetical protein